MVNYELTAVTTAALFGYYLEYGNNRLHQKNVDNIVLRLVLTPRINYDIVHGNHWKRKVHIPLII